MFCYLCKNNYCNTNTLIKHLKNEHCLNNYSTYRCYQLPCSQSFSTLNSFRKHLLKKHVNEESNFLENVDHSPIVTHTVPLPNNCPTKNKHDTEDFVKNNVEPELEILEDFSENFNFENSYDNMLKLAAKFVLSLHDNNNFSRKDVYDIIKMVEKFLISPLMTTLKAFANNTIKAYVEIYNKFLGLLTNCERIFQNVDTDHKLHKWLLESGYIKNFKEFSINKEIDNVFHNGHLNYDEIHTKGILMPIQFQFKKFFESDSLLNDTIDHIKVLENSSGLTNFIQGDLWKQKKKMYPNNILIPYFLYFDDFGINNPLGSHATTHSICNAYYSFPCLPWDEGKLENVFLAGIVKSTDLKKFDNDLCFQALVNELISLETIGIEIRDSNNVNKKIHFVLGLVLGDNLSLNSTLGFRKSFASNSYCRFCKECKDKCKIFHDENQVEMRNRKNYHEDLDQKDPYTTGIDQLCIFNSIPSFHAVENFCVDVMHDVFEGVCHYDLCQIILHFIEKMKYFDLETLNRRKQYFEYGPTEIDFISGEIKKQHLVKNHLKMSAREMMCFILYFPIMVGDLIPSDDEVWEFLLNLVEIVDLLLSFEVSERYIHHLKKKIAFHNENYTKLFKNALKPKFHNLIHYPTIIRKSGPLRKFWCFKFEAKHKQFKIYANAITSRKNICLTLAKKFELKFANQILFDKIGHNSLEYSQNDEIISNYCNLISDKLKTNKKYLKFYRRIKFNGNEFRTGYYVGILNDDVELYEIINIVVREKNSIILFAQKLNQVQYQSHFLSYEVDNKIVGEFSCLPMKDIIGPPVTLIKTGKGKSMIKIKEHFVCYIE